uniref:Testis cDNA clone: QtsA-11446, similar to human syntaxin 4A (placental) (STX4A) n=1 Tax=Macaca fascicularis TaxID=9541 RepID=Q4R8U3_MACFA|nr:unnamed protein product [Macaca fascicularis]
MLGGSPSKATLTEPLRGIRVDAVSGGGARAGARPGQAQVLETGQGAMQKGVGIWVAAEAGAILGVQLKIRISANLGGWPNLEDTKASGRESKGGRRLAVWTEPGITSGAARGTHLHLHFRSQKSEDIVQLTNTAFKLPDLTVPGRDLI